MFVAVGSSLGSCSLQRGACMLGFVASVVYVYAQPLVAQITGGNTVVAPRTSVTLSAAQSCVYLG